MKSKKNLTLKSDLNKIKEIETIFFRLFFVGDIGVGKTQIINQFVERNCRNEDTRTL